MFIKHLPKGFYEDELRQFFEQFGEVMRVAVARSRKTQRSKGYGYVQFRFYEVADIAASAVNNYMMFNSVLKTSLLPKRMFNIPKNFGKAYDSRAKDGSLPAVAEGAGEACQRVREQCGEQCAL